MQFAIIGYGKSGRAFGTLIKSLPGASVSFVVDADQQRAEVGAVDLNAGTWSNNAGRALRSADVDAVVISAPYGGLAQVARDALERGRHVLLEPPMALRHPDAQHVLANARAAPTTLAVHFWLRALPDVRRIRRRIPRPTFVQVECVVHPLTESWMGTAEHGGVMGVLGNHALDLASYLMQSKPLYAQAMGGRHTRRAALADTVAVGVRFANGGLARVIVGEFGRTRARAPWRALATDGTITATAQGSLPCGETGTGHELEAGSAHSNEADAAQFESLRAFASAAAGRGEPLAAVDDGVRAVQLADAAYEAMGSRRRVPITATSLPDAVRPVYGDDSVAHRRYHGFRA